MSAKKRAQKPSELAVYIECAKRAGCVIMEYGRSVSWPGGCCEDCGMRMHGRITLHPHHIIFRSQGGKTEPDNIAMVCPDCHSKRHNLRVLDSQPMWSRKEGA